MSKRFAKKVWTQPTRLYIVQHLRHALFSEAVNLWKLIWRSLFAPVYYSAYLSQLVVSGRRQAVSHLLAANDVQQSVRPQFQESTEHTALSCPAASIQQVSSQTGVYLEYWKIATMNLLPDAR